MTRPRWTPSTRPWPRCATSSAARRARCRRTRRAAAVSASSPRWTMPTPRCAPRARRL